MKRFIVKSAVWSMLVAVLVLLPGAITKHAAEAADAKSGATAAFQSSVAQAVGGERADFAGAAERHPGLMLSACAQKFEARHDVLWK